MKVNKANKVNKDSRRQFLKNVSVLALATSIIPKVKSADSEDFFNNVCSPTTLDLYGQGPYYTANSPDLVSNLLADINEDGQRLILTGRVLNIDCTEYISNVKIDVWQANHEGAYDNAGYNLRGVTYTNSQGFYVIETILPGKYLNGNSFRPSHMHFKITPPGFGEITTQLYFLGDEDIPGDAAASITSGEYDATNRIIPLLTVENGFQGVWDIVVNGDGTALGVADLHMDKGVIYSVSPNPFREEVNIRYGVFNTANVSLLVFDVQGKLVATLEEQILHAEQYDAVWKPEKDMPNGYYFIALKINDIQVHYLKIIKEK